jgi:hypothetical protein
MSKPESHAEPLAYCATEPAQVESPN